MTATLGIELPDPLRELCREANGEGDAATNERQRAGPLFADFRFLSLAQVARLHAERMGDREFFDEPDYEDDSVSRSPGRVRPGVFDPGWFPIGGATASCLAVDTSPAESGSVGQLIVFGSDVSPYLPCVAEDIPGLVDKVVRFPALRASGDPHLGSIDSYWTRELVRAHGSV